MSIREGYCISPVKTCSFRKVLKLEFRCFAASVFSTSVAAAIYFTVSSRFLWCLAYTELDLSRVKGKHYELALLCQKPNAASKKHRGERTCPTSKESGDC
jgi:hypothetical protein